MGVQASAFHNMSVPRSQNEWGSCTRSVVVPRTGAHCSTVVVVIKTNPFRKSRSPAQMCAGHGMRHGASAASVLEFPFTDVGSAHALTHRALFH